MREGSTRAGRAASLFLHEYAMTVAPSLPPIAVYHVASDWFRPLFAELERRELSHPASTPRLTGSRSVKPAPRVLRRRQSCQSVRVFARVTCSLLSHASLAASPRTAWYTGGQRLPKRDSLELSKATQPDLLAGLRLPFPNESDQCGNSGARRRERFAVIPHPHQGQHRRLRRRYHPQYENRKSFADAVARGGISLGIDGTASSRRKRLCAAATSPASRR